MKAMMKTSKMVLGSAILTLAMAGLASGAQATETFSLNGNKALNTNNNFRRIDGQPRMSIWQHNRNDPDQQFDRLPGRNGAVLLRHRSTGKCLNAHRLFNGAEINVWNCNANDPDQNFNLIGLGNQEFLIQRAGTNLCVDSPTCNDGGIVRLLNCNQSSLHQRFKSSLGATGNQQAEAFFRWALGQRAIQRLDRWQFNWNSDGQCVTLIVRYLQEVYLNRSTAARAYGHGKDVARGVATQHSNFFGPYTKQGLPVRGAIISFPGPLTQWGHVGIVMESRYFGTIRQVRIMDSNSDSRAPNTVVRISDWINIDGSNAYGGVNGWTNPR
ncbi:ricin-type beta-trefoil lectin domain protein [Leptothermofonsia sichuanensis E412]|uniref:ricin-type beta-trefoil lectin domain protein n=1 Tax=Leptothermofonsia sichuanensis TaxID=2917832 RepID=UPI001CA725E1|nr:ricin-type beta-trefoil lectin domain protein [Leptothermofonsia sichuanensis]QZZ22430.1 ricin-type beta-trefoil lectin domain protein [Leptothermofonsia sichuanensis E412]